MKLIYKIAKLIMDFSFIAAGTKLKKEMINKKVNIIYDLEIKIAFELKTNENLSG